MTFWEYDFPKLAIECRLKSKWSVLGWWISIFHMTRFPYWCGWILVNFLTAAMAAVGCCGSATATRWAPLSAVAWAGTGGAQARVLARNASHGSRHSLASSCAGPPARLRGQATAAALLWARNAPAPAQQLSEASQKTLQSATPESAAPNTGDVDGIIWKKSETSAAIPWAFGFSRLGI